MGKESVDGIVQLWQESAKNCLIPYLQKKVFLIVIRECKIFCVNLLD